ncbi:hypothetical protein QBC40DRAFT_49706 [Triangularia verruculosa]|uniref:Protein kinase domain-containing protein n=1 Tax=Triangularia verruculosa TaxID=2587418 RepID=A0AAN7B0D5_9PEZI|nr:hypothetical protein QBC40DRAFT_49706 [Triangularia verruculosa]
MELNSTTIHDAIHPTAAFFQDRSALDQSSPHRGASAPNPWPESQLNPKNRVDSLDPHPNPLWRIDGCTGLGTQYYAIPLFVDNLPPMRFDVFVPQETTQDPLLRQILDLDAAFHTKDSTRLNRLGITRHILRALQKWSLEGEGDAKFITALYKNNPFGSRIILEDFGYHIESIKVTIAATFTVEEQLLKPRDLVDSVGLPEGLIPDAIDISTLSIVQQLHDSVCLVRIRRGQEDAQRLWIFKALTSNAKYLIRELRNLLLMEPHPNVVSKPKYLITKYCRFGGKTAVVGFILPFYANGSLRDTVPLLHIHGLLKPKMQIMWAKQLASAVLHIRERGKIYYPDLRLDNVVLTAAGDLVMVDFEQRGVWCEFAAPEVNAITYVHTLAVDQPEEDQPDMGYGGQATLPPGEGSMTLDKASDDKLGDDAPEAEDSRLHGQFDRSKEQTNRWISILDRLLPDWQALEADEKWTPLPHGYTSYNIPWLALDAVEQEAAEVYMLGRVLWCLFEGQCAPQHAAVWQSYRREPDYEFPEYRHTPRQMRELIDGCTKGRRETLSKLVTRAGSRIVLRRKNSEVDLNCTPIEVLDAARDWWRVEVEEAERFLAKREELKDRGEWDGNPYKRLRLMEVVSRLDEYEREVGLEEMDREVLADVLKRCK